MAQPNTIAPHEPAPTGLEVAASAQQAQAIQETQALFALARRYPRSWDAVRAKLLHECQRTSFAQVAIYERPQGGRKIVGLSIRFAEAALRAAGNMMVRVAPVYDTDESTTYHVTSIDLETLAADVDSVVVTKYVERLNPKPGDEVIGVPRTNSAGKLTYKIRASDDDLRSKRRAETQRAKRNGILALIPADIRDECFKRIEEARRSDIAKDPDAERKRVVDAFASLNVPVAELVTYLGHDIGSASPAELSELGAVFVGVRDGEAPWREYLFAKTGKPGTDDEPNADLRRKVQERAAAVRAKKGTKAPAKGKADSPPAAPSEPRGPGRDEAPKDVADMMAALGCDEAVARQRLAEGWELDPSGEAVPPVGGGEP